MKVFLIRHVATGQIMPLAQRNRGYSHWNPTAKPEPLGIFTTTPGIFLSDKSARAAIAQWVALPNGRQSSYQTYYGEWDDDISTKEDGRTKADLVVVPSELAISPALERAQVVDAVDPVATTQVETSTRD